jgi:hypothetical protein
MNKIISILIFCLSVMIVNGQQVYNTNKFRQKVVKPLFLSSKFDECVDYDIVLPASPSMNTDSCKNYKRVIVQDSAGTELLSLTKNDTLIVGAVKFLKIGNKVYSVEAFKQSEVVFLPLQYWQAAIEMLRNATGVNLKPEEMIAIINVIVQQLPQPKR